MTFGSIRFRLTAWYFLSLAVILALFGFGARLAMQTSIFDAVDHDLRTRIQDVQQFIEKQMKVGPRQLINEFREQSMLGVGGSLLQVCDESGAVLYRSARLGEYPLGLTQPCLANARIAYATDRTGRSSLRVASQAVTVQGKRFIVQVAEPMHEFEESMERFQGMLLVAAPLFLILASLGGFWMSRRALAPVDRITRDARLIDQQHGGGAAAYTGGGGIRRCRHPRSGRDLGHDVGWGRGHRVGHARGNDVCGNHDEQVRPRSVEILYDISLPAAASYPSLLCSVAILLRARTRGAPGL